MEYLGILKKRFSNLPFSKKLFLGSIFISLLVFSLWAGYNLGYKKLVIKDEALSPRGTIVSGKPEEPIDFPNPINGVLFKKSEAQAWINNLPLAVMVENHTQARPQTGLSKADIVYEALAEGGITRFLAVFLQEDTRIGPVRSARSYYLDWAVEYDAAYVHFGGSPDAISKIKTYGIKDLNGLTLGAPTFERSKARSAPHNVYTTTQKLRERASSKGIKKGSDIVSWKFLDEKNIPARKDRPETFLIKLDFKGTFGYNVEWRYNADTNSYFRFNAGTSAIDNSTKLPIEAKTIIVQTVQNAPDPSGHSRLKMTTVGSNSVAVFENGTFIEGSWKKDSRTARTLFYDRAGEEIKLNRGKIWVEIIPPGSKFTHS